MHGTSPSRERRNAQCFQEFPRGRIALRKVRKEDTGFGPSRFESIIMIAVLHGQVLYKVSEQ